MGDTTNAVAVTVKESGSIAGQVLLLAGYTESQDEYPTLHLVDLCHRGMHTAAKPPRRSRNVYGCAVA